MRVICELSPPKVAKQADTSDPKRMDIARFDHLSRRQQQCLRLVRDGMTTKEIAAAIGLSPSTVDSYIADAVKAVGASDRRAAARAFVDRDAIPEQSGPGFPRLVEDAPLAPTPAASEERPPAGWQLPLRRNGLVPGDVSKGRRLVWIVAIPVALSVGFGMLMTGLDVLGRVVTAFAHQFH